MVVLGAPVVEWLCGGGDCGGNGAVVLVVVVECVTVLEWW